MNGPKSACSNVGSVLGFACTTKRIRAAMLSKMYWSKFGLLGFFEITPRMATSRWSIRS